MKLICAVLFFVTAICRTAIAQENPPHIAGKVNISMAEGLIKCDLQLSGLPSLGKQYKLLLNHGFNIDLLRNDTGKVLYYNGLYSGKMKGEANAYVPVIGDDTVQSPKSLRISYTGAFPIYTDTLNASDFKGLIAFNGKTVRAAEQSKWYPVIYDVSNDKELLEVTYDITVECKDCKTIYLNGAGDKAGPVASFRADKPYQLLLFAGDYDVQRLSSSVFLNAGLSSAEADVFNQNIASITDYYTRYLGMPYGEKISFLQHRAVMSFTGSWGFVTFPTIAIAGKSLQSQVDLQTGLFKKASNYSFYAHELGHYYFGHVLQSSAALRWFFLESMAEFLSIKATEAKYGKPATQKYITDTKSEIGSLHVKPLSKITNFEDMSDPYRYEYAPLILLAMEKRFGEEKVRLFCQHALKDNGQPTDYPFLLKLVASAGIGEREWKTFEAQVVDQEDCKNIFNYL